MTACLFASDLHGQEERYRKLFERIRAERPAVVLMAGDLLPLGEAGFVGRILAAGCRELRRGLAAACPRLMLIPGNDDPRSCESALEEGQREGLWHYLHGRSLQVGEHRFYGYACVPPTPFLLKDWERYDVSRQLEPGCVSPEEGWRSVPGNHQDAAAATIRDDLERLAGEDETGRAVFLFHAPPYGGLLDLADLAGRKVEHAPLDPHVGSLAVRRFIEARQPLVTLHGHVHESSRLSGAWRERLGQTHCFSAAWDGPELALVRFTLEEPQ